MSTASSHGPSGSPSAAMRSRGEQRFDAPDPVLVAETKNEIRLLVQEISELAQADISASEFYAAFLTRVVSALGAVGGAVWRVEEGGRLQLAYQSNLASAGLDSQLEVQPRHARLLKQTLAANQATTVPPKAGGEDGAGNPSELLLVLAPLVIEKQPQAIVEIFQRPGGGPTTQRGYLRFVVQMCDLACEFLRNQRLRQLTESQNLWRQIDEFVHEIHKSLDVRATSFSIVNEARRLIGCDRVSLAIAYGNHCRVEAISGLDSLDRRAAEVQRLDDLATAVLRTGEPVWQSTAPQELPPQIEEPLEQYVDLAHSRMIAVLPLVPRVSGPDSSALGERPRGVLVVEQLRDARATDVVRQRTELVAQHSAVALANAIDHSSLFLLPVWQALGRATWLFRGRTLPKTLLAAGAFAAIVTALAIIPTDFEVAARGKLQPVERQEIFTPLDGIVSEVPVRHGEQVTSGTVLARLKSTSLELELAALIGRQTTNAEQLAARQRALLDNSRGPRLSPIEEDRLSGELLELRQEAENIERELALVREKQQQLTVIAPVPGEVVTWKIEDVLLGRPVIRGQSLMTLANAGGEWELELCLPERRLKHLQESKLEARSVSEGAADSPDVVFTLSSHPGQQFHGRIVEIEQTAEVRGEEGNTVLVRVAIDKSQLPPLHDQTTVTAKLDCGRRSIGYVWFCDLIETVQTKVLFWLPS